MEIDRARVGSTTARARKERARRQARMDGRSVDSSSSAPGPWGTAVGHESDVIVPLLNHIYNCRLIDHHKSMSSLPVAKSEQIAKIGPGRRQTQRCLHGRVCLPLVLELRCMTDCDAKIRPGRCHSKKCLDGRAHASLELRCMTNRTKIRGSLVFSGPWFGIYLPLPPETYKIMSWKNKEFEDLEYLLVSFEIYFIIVEVSSCISTMYYLLL
jgi:hypothetical protein